MAFVHHPTGEAATEYVGGRIVRFDDEGVAQVGLPHLLEHYGRREGYVIEQEHSGEPGPLPQLPDSHYPADATPLDPAGDSDDDDDV